MHECQALSSGKLSLVNTSLLPIFGQSLLPSTKIQKPWQKEPHQVYTLQDAYLGKHLLHQNKHNPMLLEIRESVKSTKTSERKVKVQSMDKLQSK